MSESYPVEVLKRALKADLGQEIRVRVRSNDGYYTVTFKEGECGGTSSVQLKLATLSSVLRWWRKKRTGQ